MSPTLRSALEARLNEKGELHLDSESTAVILSWLRVLERESAMADDYIMELAKLIEPIRRFQDGEATERGDGG